MYSRIFEKLKKKNFPIHKFNNLEHIKTMFPELQTQRVKFNNIPIYFSSDSQQSNTFVTIHFLVNIYCRYIDILRRSRTMTSYNDEACRKANSIFHWQRNHLRVARLICCTPGQRIFESHREFAHSTMNFGNPITPLMGKRS